jgi:hypothetical protein
MLKNAWAKIRKLLAGNLVEDVPQEIAACEACRDKPNGCSVEEQKRCEQLRYCGGK